MYLSNKKRKQLNQQLADQLLKQVHVCMPGQTLIFRYDGNLTAEGRASLAQGLDIICSKAKVSFVLIDSQLKLEGVIQPEDKNAAQPEASA